MVKNSLLFSILLSISFGCASNSIDQKSIDDLIVMSTQYIRNKNFSGAEIILEKLIKEEKLTFSQKSNVLYKLLELSHINKNYSESGKYGNQLLFLLSKNEKYFEAKSRLIVRICESEDWSPAQSYFDDICNKRQNSNKRGR